MGFVSLYAVMVSAVERLCERRTGMIVNIPLQIDEKTLEQMVERDYQGKVLEEIVKIIKTTLSNHSGSYYGSSRYVEGMEIMIEEQISEYLQKYSSEIIDKASAILAERLARSKKGKEILEHVGEQDA